MSEKVIYKKNAPYFLLILVPAALALSTIFVAWRQILVGMGIFVGIGIYQLKKWGETVRSIDPFFQNLIVQNRGEISPIDLTIAANISGAQATKYLAEKAQEFGTGSRQYANRGQVYYFISVSTLGSIFDDSEDVDILPTILASQTPIAALEPAPISPTNIEIDSPVAIEIPLVYPPEDPVVENSSFELDNLSKLVDDIPAPIPNPLMIDRSVVKIIQSELAKRLDVHSSTIYKRRSEPDFIDWTRNRDPEGLAWAYAEDTKEYYRVDS